MRQAAPLHRDREIKFKTQVAENTYPGREKGNTSVIMQNGEQSAKIMAQSGR
jgi:hypothetical protein